MLSEFSNQCTALSAGLTLFQCHIVPMSKEGDSVETDGDWRVGTGTGKAEYRCVTRWTFLWHPQPTPFMRCLLQLVTGLTNVADSAIPWIRPTRFSVDGCWRWRTWNTDALTAREGKKKTKKQKLSPPCDFEKSRTLNSKSIVPSCQLWFSDYIVSSEITQTAHRDYINTKIILLCLVDCWLIPQSVTVQVIWC